MVLRPIHAIRTSRRRLIGRIAAILGVIVIATAVTIYAIAGFFDRDPARFFAANHNNGTYAALYLSGDMGLRFGMGTHATRALSTHGIPVFGLNSSTAFATHRTRAQLDAILAKATRAALAKTGAKKLILIGQSFGADILQTGLASFPPALRAKVAAVVLVVPGRNVYFRADPTSLYYHGRPDSQGSATGLKINWVPLICIYGAQETDSLCPDLTQSNAVVIRLPGGHFLNRDPRLLAHVLLTAIARAAPGSITGPV